MPGRRFWTFSENRLFRPSAASLRPPLQEASSAPLEASGASLRASGASLEASEASPEASGASLCHRSVGGIRVSLFNSIDDDMFDYFMKYFKNYVRGIK